MHHSTDRITHTTASVTPVVEHWLEREIAQWVHPMKDRSDDPLHHERTLLPQSLLHSNYVLYGVGLTNEDDCLNRMTSDEFVASHSDTLIH